MTWKYLILCVWLIGWASLAISPAKAQTLSQKQLAELEKGLATSTSDTARIHLLNRLSKEYSTSQVDKGIAYGKEALRLSKQTGYRKGEADACTRIAKIMTKLDNSDSVRILCQQAMPIYRHLKDKLGLATCLQVLATHYSFLDEFAKAIAANDQALPLFKAIGNKQGLATTYNSYGMLYLNQSDYIKALHYFQQAEGLYEELQDSSGVATTLNNLCIVYGEQHQFKSALAQLEKAIRILQNTDDKLLKARTHNNLGAVYKLLNNNALAIVHYEKSLAISEQMNNQEGIGLCLNNIGQIKLGQKQYQQALDDQLKALAIYERMGYKTGIVFTLIEIGTIYEETGQLEPAVLYGKKGLNLSREIQSLFYERDALRLLSSAYKKKKDYDDALSYFELYKQREDSLINEENIRKLEEIRFGYRLDKKDAENNKLRQEKDLQQARTEKQWMFVLLIGAGLLLAIVLLLFLWRVLWVSKRMNRRLTQQKAQIQEQNDSLEALHEEVSQQWDDLLHLHEQSESQKAYILLQNEELQATNEKLSELDQEKDGLMSVVAHDLKAPLNRTMGLSQLIRLAGPLNETQSLYMSLIEKVVKDGSQLILDLLTLNQAQQPVAGHEATSLNLSEWMQSVVTGYEGQATAKQIRLLYQPFALDCRMEADEGSLSRIMDNLISNALKFSEPGKQIGIMLNQQDDQVSIAIRDEGPGISAEDQAKLFRKFQRLSAQPTQGESSTGLGLAIVKALVEKMGGEIRVESELGKGTQFTLLLPSQLPRAA